jgi:uncharacterized membrane protein
MERNTAILVFVGALGLVEVVAAGIFGISDLLVGALFVFVLPGYAIASAVFDLRTWRLAERILLSVGLSIAIVIVGGLLINLIPLGLETTSWGALLGNITAGGAALALIRWWKKPTHAPPDPAMALGQDESSPPDTYFASPLVRVMAMASVVAVTGAFAISLVTAQHTPPAGFTQLWLLPPANSSSVQIGVRNQEKTTKVYNLQLTASGASVYTWYYISLKPGQSWTGTAPLPAQVANSSFKVPVVATLYLTSAPDQPYRQTLIWVSSTG